MFRIRRQLDYIFFNVHSLATDGIIALQTLLSGFFAEVAMDIFLLSVNWHIDSVWSVEKSFRKIFQIISIQADYP